MEIKILTGMEKSQEEVIELECKTGNFKQMKTNILYIVFFLVFFISANAQIDKENIKETVGNYSRKSDNTAVLVLVENQGEVFSYATGLSNKENTKKATVNDLFEIGSASKMFTAIAIQQLIEQGKLSLQTPISKFYPKGNIRKLGNYKGKNFFDKVTIEMILNHTSGFVDYINVYGNNEKAMEIFSIKGKVYSFDEIINLAVDHGDANFNPGEKFKYCNTGYIILGDMISKISNMNWRDYILKNIFDKAEMKDTYFGSRFPKSEEGRMMEGYYNMKSSFMPPTLAGSAGEIISSLQDMKKFLIAWQKGDLYANPKTLQKQKTNGYHKMYDGVEQLKYGYGVMNISGFYGHGGQTFGFQSYATYNPETKYLYVIATNDATVAAMSLFLVLENLTF